MSSFARRHRDREQPRQRSVYGERPVIADERAEEQWRPLGQLDPHTHLWIGGLQLLRLPAPGEVRSRED